MKQNEYYTQRARAAYAAAEICSDPQDKAAYRGAAQTWERLANPVAGGYSLKPHTQQLTALKRDAAAVDTPVAAPAVKEVVEAPVPRMQAARYLAKQPAIIEF